MPVRLMITFPYSAKSPDVYDKLSQVLSIARERQLHTSERPPLLVINNDSLDNYKDFCKNYSTLKGSYSPHYVWAVDTCQMWLAGWGKILDDNRDQKSKMPPDKGIIQVPGDLATIKSENPHEQDPFQHFISQLTTMRLWLGDGKGAKKVHFILGDFEVAPQKAKQLIDTYGTFPLLYNWFPKIAEELRKLRINRPRSEFFAASTEFLEKLTTKPLRKFAYEQTLVLLIHAIRAGGWRIERQHIGIIEDYGGDRGFREATDQIERTERVLKLLWRETNSAGSQGFRREEFEKLDERSTAIRRNAMICCKNILDPAGS